MTLIDGLESFIVMFLSAVWTLILTAPIHCRGSIGEQVVNTFLQICSEEENLIYILDGLKVSTFFGWTIHLMPTALLRITFKTKVIFFNLSFAVLNYSMH